MRNKLDDRVENVRCIYLSLRSFGCQLLIDRRVLPSIKQREFEEGRFRLINQQKKNRNSESLALYFEVVLFEVSVKRGTSSQHPTRYLVADLQMPPAPWNLKKLSRGPGGNRKAS